MRSSFQNLLRRFKNVPISFWLFSVLLNIVFLWHFYVLQQKPEVSIQLEPVGLSQQDSSGSVPKNIVSIGDDGENLYLRVNDEIIRGSDNAETGVESINTSSINVDAMEWKEVSLHGFDSDENFLAWSDFSQVPGKKAAIFTSNYGDDKPLLISSHSGGNTSRFAIYYIDLDNLWAYGHSGEVQPLFTSAHNDFFSTKAAPSFISWSPSGKLAQIHLQECFGCDGGNGPVTAVISVEKEDFTQRADFKILGHVQDFSWQADDSFRYRLEQEKCRVYNQDHSFFTVNDSCAKGVSFTVDSL